MEDNKPPHDGTVLPHDGMESNKVHIDNPKDLPFFDSTAGLSEQEQADIDAATKSEANKKRNRKKRKTRKTAKQVKKYNGVFALPVYLHTYKCMLECRYRFRETPRSSKYIARDIESRLLNIMADISMVYWNVQPYTMLVETYRKVLMVVIMIRSLRDDKILSGKDYGCIAEHAAKMIKNMVAWSNKYNPDNQQLNAFSGTDILTAKYETPRMDIEEDNTADETSEDNGQKAE